MAYKYRSYVKRRIKRICTVLEHEGETITKIMLDYESSHPDIAGGFKSAGQGLILVIDLLTKTANKI